MTKSRTTTQGVSRDAKTGRLLVETSRGAGFSKLATSNAGGSTPITYSTVKSGMPAKSVKRYVESGRLTRADVALVIPRRTFERRLAEDQALKVDEADAIARLLRVRDHARLVFEDDEVADEWLGTENPALGGEVPIRMARTDVGAREVEAVLTRFAHGVHG